jgi:hypothetical protein
MVGDVLLPNAQHIQCEAERPSPWRCRSQRLPRGSLRSPQTYQGVSASPPLRHKGSVPMVLQGVCGLMAGESDSPVTSPSCTIPKRRWESKESLGVSTLSGFFPTLRQPISTWTAGGHRLAPRRASDGWTAAPVAPARLVCQAYHRCPGCMGCPSPPFPLLHVSGCRFYNSVM